MSKSDITKLANLVISDLLMRRLPNKIRGNGREATFHNHMREMVKNLRPVRSANVQTRFTSSGVIRAAQAQATETSAGSGKAVWL